MTRTLYWCSVCGAPTDRAPDDGRFARCRAHSALPKTRDLIPPDPLDSLPTMAADLRPDLHERNVAAGKGVLPWLRRPPSGEDSTPHGEKGRS